MASQVASQLRHVASDPNMAPRPGLTAKRAVGMAPLALKNTSDEDSDELEICDSPGWDGYHKKKKDKQAQKERKAAEKAEKKKLKEKQSNNKLTKGASALGGPRMGEAAESATSSSEGERKKQARLPDLSKLRRLSKSASIADLRGHKAPNTGSGLSNGHSALSQNSLSPYSGLSPAASSTQLSTRPPHTRRPSNGSDLSEEYEQELAREIYHMNMDSRPPSSHYKSRAFDAEAASEPMPYLPSDFLKSHSSQGSGDSRDTVHRSVNSRQSTRSKKSSESSHERGDSGDYVSLSDSSYDEEFDPVATNYHQAVSGYSETPRYAHDESKKSGLFGLKWPMRRNPESDLSSGSASPVIGVERSQRKQHTDLKPDERSGEMTPDSLDGGRPKGSKAERILGERIPPRVDTSPVPNVPTPAASPAPPKADAAEYGEVSPTNAQSIQSMARAKEEDAKTEEMLARRKTPHLDKEEQERVLAQLREASESKMSRAEAIRAAHLARVATLPPLEPTLRDKPVSIIKESDKDLPRSKSPSIKRVTIKSEPDTPPEDGSPKRSPSKKKYTGYPTPPGSARASSDSMASLQNLDEHRSVRQASSRLHSRQRAKHSPNLGPQPTPLIKPIAKVFVVCCNCRYWHDMPSRVFELIARPPIIDEEDDGASNSQLVRCPWCEHPMNTRCCAGWAGVVQLTERLH